MKTDHSILRLSTALKGLDMAETEAWAQSQGLPVYRGRQIRHWIFTKGARSFEQMTDLPKALRETLTKRVILNHLETVDILESRDGTKKFIFRLHDGLLIESVLIPERDHLTLCISSQVGCAIGCRFCLTGVSGLKRNLSAAEIVDQVVQVRATLPEPEHLKNIVLMGMGEPLANYQNVVKALGNLTRKDGMNFSNRRVTLSTSGLIPEMEKLGQEIRVNLAVSLNATDDKTRSFIMPINDRYPIAALIQVCKAFPLPNRRMITFEYVLIKGINDSLEDARRLVKLLRGLRAKVNLIPFNRHQGIDFEPTPMGRVLQFQEVLAENHLTAIIRKSKGPDIMAACGQLGGASNRGIQ